MSLARLRDLSHLLTTIVFAMLWLLLRPTYGQSVSGMVQGKVMNTAGTRLAGAIATLSNPKTAVNKTAITNDKGYFTFAQLSPGGYSLEVQMAGYKPYSKAIILDTVGRINASPIKLNSLSSSGSDGHDLLASAEGLLIVLEPLAENGKTIPKQRSEAVTDFGSFALWGMNDLLTAKRRDGSSTLGSIKAVITYPGDLRRSTQNPSGQAPVGNGGNPIPQSKTAPASSQSSPLVPGNLKVDAGRMQLQSLSGERSDLITNNQIVNLALNGRDLLDLLKLLPGANSLFDGQLSRPDGLDVITLNGARRTQPELLIDGSSNLDTKLNTVRHVTINPDAVAEIKVLTSNYQAEYGKSAGGLIQIVTKSGTTEFHGGGRFFYRHESLNANNFFGNANKVPRPLYRYNSFGYDFGGPVFLPRFGEGGKAVKKINNLFFFVNQEYYRQLIPNPPRFIRVPTARERNGDFSQTLSTEFFGSELVDPKMIDPETRRKLPFPGKNIPRDRWFSPGQNILNLYPLPNLELVNGFNYVSQISQYSPRREDIVRIDYRPTDKTEIMTRIVNNSDRQDAVYGGPLARLNYPVTPIVFQRPGTNFAFTATHYFTNTLINELIIGPSRNQIDLNPKDDRLTRQLNNLNFPLLFPEVNRGDLIPNFFFGGVAGPNTSILGLPFKSNNLTLNFIDNLSKVWRNHTIKGGIFIQHARKNETLSGNPFATNANVDFNSQDNYPLNTGHPFANALLGYYRSYEQANTAPTGFYRYNNIEGYLQDLWRLNDRLVLDLGLRVSWYQPQYDKLNQVAVFHPDRFDPVKSPKLYLQAFDQKGDKIAVDPTDRNKVLPSDYIGQIVPGTGDLTNGIGLASRGYPRGGFEGRGAQWGPRIGFAYDMFGNGRTILRGGFGIFYDRIPGDRIRDLITNPPNVFAPRLLFGDLRGIEKLRGQSINTPGSQVLLSPPSVVGFARDGKLPTVSSFSLNIQRDIGWETVIDIAYVGSLSHHLMQTRNLNAIPYGKIFSKGAQDPSRFPDGVVPESDPSIPQAYQKAGLKFDGTKAYTINFLRPFPGYADIFFREFVGSSNYHSLQISARRRLSRDLNFGVAYTWSKALSTATNDTDASTLVDPNTPFSLRDYDYRLTNFHREHIFAASYIYTLPNLGRRLSQNPLLRGVLDGWQISGITQFSSGRPIELNILNAGEFSTGSYSQAARFYLIANPQPGPNGLLINPSALALPGVGDIRPWPRNFLIAGGINNHDISILKNIPLAKEGQSLQLRIEMFNAFNHTQFVGIFQGGFSGNFATGETQFNIRGAANPTLRSSGCRTDLALGQCFGEPNRARDPRIIQLGMKLNF